MAKFEVGDKVTCIDYGGNGLHHYVGRTYTVIVTSTTSGKYVRAKDDISGIWEPLFREDELRPVGREFKVFDRVQVKQDTNPAELHPSWSGVPGVLHSTANLGDDLDGESTEDYPWVIVFDSDEREFLFLKNTNDLEHI